MVAIVYKRSSSDIKRVLELRDGFSGQCDVSDYYEDVHTPYSSQIIIGDDFRDHIILRGAVVHNVVKSVMRGVSRNTKRGMIEYLEWLIREEEGNV